MACDLLSLVDLAIPSSKERGLRCRTYQDGLDVL